MDELMSKLKISKDNDAIVEDEVSAITRKFEALSLKDSAEQILIVQDTFQNPGSSQPKVEDEFAKPLEQLQLCASSDHCLPSSDSPIHGNNGNNEALGSSIVAYSPDTQETRYYDQNKILFYSYVERMLRQGRDLHPACFK